MTKRTPGTPIPPRSSLNLDRRTLHLNLTDREYATIADRATIAGLSRPRYLREAALAFQIYRTTSPTEMLSSTTAAIACVRALASTPAVRLQYKTWREFDAAIAELRAKSAEFERHADRVAALLALLPPNSPDAVAGDRHLPGPGSAMWRELTSDVHRW
jgi:hypothetical protein